MAGIGVVAAAAGEVVGREDGKVVGILAGSAARALRLDWCNRAAGCRCRVHAGRVVGGIDHAQVVVFAQEGLSVLRADLDVVDALGVGEVRVDAGVGEGAVLGDGGGLQICGTEIGEGIAAGVVVVFVSADEGAQVEDHVCCR